MHHEPWVYTVYTVETQPVGRPAEAAGRVSPAQPVPGPDRPLPSPFPSSSWRTLAAATLQTPGLGVGSLPVTAKQTPQLSSLKWASMLRDQWVYRLLWSQLGLPLSGGRGRCEWGQP